MSSRLVALERRGELGRALDEIDAYLRSQSVGEEQMGEIRLVAEEGLTNVLDHAYGAEAVGRVEALVSVAADSICIEFRDWGPPFDPLGLEAPSLEAPLEQRPLGGLGVHLMKSLTDEQRYSRRGNANVLVLVKRRARL